MEHKKIVKILLVIVFLFTLWFVSIAYKFPVLGVNLSYDQKIEHWVVSMIDPGGTGPKHGIHVGDVILRVDGVDANDFPSVIKWRTLDQSKSIELLRDGTKHVVDLRYVQSYTGQDSSKIIIGVFCTFLVVFFIRLGHLKSAFYLSLILISIGLTFLSLPASARGDSLGKYIAGSMVMLLPAFFLNFLVVLLKEKANIVVRIKSIKLFYWIAAIGVVVQILFFFERLANYIHRWSGLMIISVFVIGVIWNFSVWITLYIRHRKIQTNIATIMKFIFASLVISFSPIVFISFIPRLHTGDYSIDPYYSSLFILFFPISFTYLIAAKKLYDIDVVVRRMLFVTSISLLPSVLLTVLIGIIAKEASFNELFLIFMLILPTLAFMLYSLEYLTTRLEKVIFPRKHALNMALKNISKNLGSISSFHELKEIVLVDIVRTLDVYGAAVVLRTGDNVEVIAAGAIDEEELSRVSLGAIRKHASFTCLDIQRNEEYESCLVLTQKRSHTMIGLEETQWLNLIVTYLSVSLENVHLIRKLMGRLEHLAGRLPNEQEAGDIAWFRKLMFRLQEKERMRMANDLHDTTLQDLFFLKRKLMALAGDSRVPQLMEEQLHSIADYVEVINMNLRQSCFELNPHLLTELGLVRTIGKLVETEQVSSGFEIQFLTTGDRRHIEGLELESQRYLFRIVQELLNNAKKHSEAKRVIFQIAGTVSGVQLVYEDDGVGFEAEREHESEVGASGTGLDQIKGRVMSMNGQFELLARVGQGVKITIWIPGREERAV